MFFAYMAMDQLNLLGNGHYLCYFQLDNVFLKIFHSKRSLPRNCLAWLISNELICGHYSTHWSDGLSNLANWIFSRGVKRHNRN